MMTHSRLTQLAWLGICCVGVCCVVLASSRPVDGQVPGPPQPTEHHRLLKGDVGTWDAKMNVWFTPDAEPMTSQGTETNELLGNGMWLVSHFDGDIAGTPFVGLGTMGYDPLKRKYVGTWIDNVTPHLSVMEGDYDAKDKTLTMISERPGPDGRETRTVKSILKYVDADTRSFEIQVQGDDGKFWKMLETQYTRRAE